VAGVPPPSHRPDPASRPTIWQLITSSRSKERNRAAQRRYRDRQRSRLAEREEQLAALTEKLSLVLNEKVGGHIVFTIFTK